MAPNFWFVHNINNDIIATSLASTEVIEKISTDLKGATTLIIAAFSITTLGILGLFLTLSINDTQHNMFECNYAVRCYAQCHYAESRHDECRRAI